jgi:hypothetical protein
MLMGKWEVFLAERRKAATLKGGRGDSALAIEKDHHLLP